MVEDEKKEEVAVEAKTAKPAKVEVVTERPESAVAATTNKAGAAPKPKAEPAKAKKKK